MGRGWISKTLMGMKLMLGLYIDPMLGNAVGTWKGRASTVLLVELLGMVHTLGAVS